MVKYVQRNFIAFSNRQDICYMNMFIGAFLLWSQYNTQNCERQGVRSTCFIFQSFQIVCHHMRLALNKIKIAFLKYLDVLNTTLFSTAHMYCQPFCSVVSLRFFYQSMNGIGRDRTGNRASERMSRKRRFYKTIFQHFLL